MTGTEASGRRAAGRHGADGSGGLSAAELIARSRAAAGARTVTSTLRERPLRRMKWLG